MSKEEEEEGGISLFFAAKVFFKETGHASLGFPPSLDDVVFLL